MSVTSCAAMPRSRIDSGSRPCSMWIREKSSASWCPATESRSHAAATVDVEGVAGQVVGTLGGQEYRERAGVLLGIAEAGQWDVGQRVLEVLGVLVEILLRTLGQHARDDVVDGDVVLRPFASRGAGQRANGLLGRVVTEHADVSEQ